MKMNERRGLTACTRDYALSGIEVRAPQEGTKIANFRGHAAATGLAYEVYGGPEMGGWMETVEPGAFKRTLGRNPDVAFLLNHGGTTMARTQAGTMTLAEDGAGLVVDAQLNTERSDVNDLVIAMRDKNINEMSFAFRVTQQQWLNGAGEEVDWRDLSGIDRRIQAVDIHKGDVSAVNYGANPYTDASLRSLLTHADPEQVAELRRMASLVAVAEQRAGMTLSPATTAVLQSVLGGLTTADDNIDDALNSLAELLGVPNPDDNVAEPDAGDPGDVTNPIDPGGTGADPGTMMGQTSYADIAAEQLRIYARGLALRAELL